MGDTFEVRVAYHQVALTPMNVSPVLDPKGPADLVQVYDPVGLIVLTGIAQGPVRMTVTMADAPVPVSPGGAR